MSVVVDASALIAALVDDGPKGKWAEEILTDLELHAPEFARAETVNVLRRLELAKSITGAKANLAFDIFMRLPIELHPFQPFAERIWAVRGTLTSYDAWYVALAEALDFPLATLDLRLARARGVNCRFLVPGGH